MTIGCATERTEPKPALAKGYSAAHFYPVTGSPLFFTDEKIIQYSTAKVKGCPARHATVYPRRLITPPGLSRFGPGSLLADRGLFCELFFVFVRYPLIY